MSSVSKKKDVIEKNREYPWETKEVTKKPSTTAGPDRGTDGIKFAIEENENKMQEVDENKIAGGNEHEIPAANFEGKVVTNRKNIKNSKEVVLLLPRQNFQQSNKLCNEIDASGEESRTRYEQFVEIFRNLNLFLKKEKSSDLRMLLDDSDSNKTLVERLKEALHAKNSTEVSKLKVANKMVRQNGIEEQEQQFGDSIEEVYDDSSTPVRGNFANINGTFQHKSIATSLQSIKGRNTVTDHKCNATKHSKIKIDGNEKLLERPEVNDDQVHGMVKEKLESMLTESLWHLFNLDSTATSKINNVIKEQINRNKVHFDEVKEQRLGASSLLSSGQKNVTEYTTSVPHTFIDNANSTQRTSEKSAELSNEIEIPHELLNDNITLFEEVGRIETNQSIEKVIDNMKHNLQAGEEIKRAFSYPRRPL